jgi:Sulfotransferase family
MAAIVVWQMPAMSPRLRGDKLFLDSAPRVHTVDSAAMSNVLFQGMPPSESQQSPAIGMSASAVAANPVSREPFSYQDLHAGIEHFLTKELFFIGAHPKSGTTWLQVMLNAHPEISCSGEGHFINRFAPLLETAVKTHNQLIARKNGSIFREFQPFPLFGQQEFAYLMASAISLMLMRATDYQHVRVLGEKTPDNVLHFLQLAAIFPRAKFLHVLRDGRDCVVSTWFHNLRVNPEETQRRYKGLPDFIAFMAKSWNTYVDRGLRFQAAYPDRCLTVRYEDLVANPRDSMRRVFRFLAVDVSLGVVRRCVEAGKFETMSGGRQAGIEDRTSFLRQGTPGNWRQHLTPEDNRIFLDIAGNKMMQLGYKD